MTKTKISKQYLKEKWSKTGRPVRKFANYYIEERDDKFIFIEKSTLLGRFISLIWFIIWSPLFLSSMAILWLSEAIEKIMPTVYFKPSWVNPLFGKNIRTDYLIKEHAKEYIEESK